MPADETAVLVSTSRMFEPTCAPKDPGGTQDDRMHRSGDAAAGSTSDAGTDSEGASDAPADTGNAVATLNGAVQKGPFVLGSSVQLSAIDSSGPLRVQTSVSVCPWWFLSWETT